MENKRHEGRSGKGERAKKRDPGKRGSVRGGSKRRKLIAKKRRATLGFKTPTTPNEDREFAKKK